MTKQIPNRNRMESLRKELGFKDSEIFEKAVYAFDLLSELFGIYPNLIFKGGTSILLHIFPPARLSIDIDVLLPVKERTGLKDALIKMATAAEWFDTVEEDIRGVFLLGFGCWGKGVRSCSKERKRSEVEFL